METMGDRIKKLRERANMTQEELAKELNTSSKYVSSIECNRRSAGVMLLPRLCEVLKVSESVLRFGAPKPLHSEPVQKVIDMLESLPELAQWECYIDLRKALEK